MLMLPFKGRWVEAGVVYPFPRNVQLTAETSIRKQLKNIPKTLKGLRRSYDYIYRYRIQF